MGVEPLCLSISVDAQSHKCSRDLEEGLSWVPGRPSSLFPARGPNLLGLKAPLPVGYPWDLTFFICVMWVPPSFTTFSRGLNEIHVHGAQHGAQTRQLPCLTSWVVWLLEIPKALQPPPPRFVEGSWKLCGSGPCPHLCLPPSTCDFPKAAVPKYPRLGGFDTRNVLPCSSGGRKSRGRTLSGVVPSGGSEAGICPRPLP